MSNKPTKILLIEDNPGDTRLIREMLAELGQVKYQLECADQLSKGLECLVKGGIDIVLLDLGLPDSQGLDTLGELIAQTLAVPIVVLTGLDDDTVGVQAVRQGAQDYLLKADVHSKLLQRVIDYAIERFHAQRELQRYVRRLESAEARFRKMIEENADGIVIMDRNGTVVFVNPSAESLFARKAEDFLGEQVGYPIVAGETTEVDIIHNGGELAIVEMRVVETEWEDEVAYLASLRDITEHRQAHEALVELDRAKSEFISNVSHELRTPLQSIRGFTKLMLMGKVPDPETQKEFLSIMERESKHLSGLIEGLLDMSRLESGRFQIQKQRMSIENIISDAIGNFYSLASERGVVIHMDILSALPEMEVDGERLGQVMFNLLSNALKFSPDSGDVTVKAEVKNSDLMVQVSDCGIGIPNEVMPYLFQRFYRAKDPMARGGTGLGLYISKHIIEAHGGHIWVESKLGEGSTVSFTLPLNQDGDGSHE